MLVFSRKINESVVIQDGQIIVTLVEIRGDKVKLGIVALPHISVDRQEVYQAKLANKGERAKKAE